MPDMNGVELHQILVARESAWPTIFLTGQDDTPMSVKVKNQRTVGFFTKPIDCETLLGAVEKAIEQDRTARLGSHNGAPGSMTSAIAPKRNSASVRNRDAKEMREREAFSGAAQGRTRQG
jgi:FixJ family two-component response regulator